MNNELKDDSGTLPFVPSTHFAKDIREVIYKAEWVGFDLDDTLHEFRRASRQATTSALHPISKRFGLAIAHLENEYRIILKDKTQGSFTDGRASFDYRRDRFEALMARLGLSPDSATVEECLEAYESVLKSSLELKPGAVSLLDSLRTLGKKIVIITEGPQDAQERTLEGLAIDKYVDVLITSNRFGVSKTDGLFAEALCHLEIAPDKLLFIGDSESRDIIPAVAEGIKCIHYDETDEKAQDCLHDWPLRLNSLKTIETIIVDENY